MICYQTERRLDLYLSTRVMTCSMIKLSKVQKWSILYTDFGEIELVVRTLVNRVPPIINDFRSEFLWTSEHSKLETNHNAHFCSNRIVFLVRAIVTRRSYCWQCSVSRHTYALRFFKLKFPNKSLIPSWWHPPHPQGWHPISDCM